jgi:hypothetical protein
MTSGIGIYAIDPLLYLILFGTIEFVIVSTILLITKGKRINKSTHVFVIALIITALSIAAYLMVIAMAFGNTHPSASPVPL